MTNSAGAEPRSSIATRQAAGLHGAARIFIVHIAARTQLLTIGLEPYDAVNRLLEDPTERGGG
jgi:hypothetical protein